MATETQRSRWWPWLASPFKSQESALLVGILVVLAVIYLLDRDHAFYSSYSLRTLLHTAARFGVLAVGAAVVIIAGGIDLSSGAVVALASVVSAKLLTEWLRDSSSLPPSTGLIVVAIVLTVLMGTSVGVGHAVVINLMRVPPFIATLATMAGLRSLASILSQKKTINMPFAAYRALGNDPWVTIPLFVFVALLLSVVMGRTVLGRHLYALGGNEMAAKLSGLRTQRLKLIAYAISGTLSALGGVLFAGSTGQGDSESGKTYELTAITAAVVGGCSLSGGVGSIRGTVLGLLLTSIVIKGTGILARGLDSTQIEGLVLGTVVLLAVAFNQRFRGGRA